MKCPTCKGTGKIPEYRTCLRCMANFIVHRKDQKYCGGRCSQLAASQRWWSKTRIAGREHAVRPRPA